MSSSLHIDNREKDILILAEGPTQGLDNTTLAAEAKYPINFTQSERRFVLNVHCNGSSSFLFVNDRKICQFQAKSSKVKDYAPSLGNISEAFTIDKVETRGLKGVVKCFSVDFNPIDINSVLDVYKYLMNRTWYKITFGIIKKMFIVLVRNIVNGSNHTKWVLLSSQLCMTQPALINLHLNPNLYGGEVILTPLPAVGFPLITPNGKSCNSGILHHSVTFY